MKHKTWVEISRRAIGHNVRDVRRLVKPAEVMAVVKSNAYGHGAESVAGIALKNGAKWLGVDSISEANVLRRKIQKNPVLILGYTMSHQMKDAVRQSVSFVAYSREMILAARQAGTFVRPARIHLKLETGTTRQGIGDEELKELLPILKHSKNVIVEGVSTHFANIEDTRDVSYAMSQLKRYYHGLVLLKDAGIEPAWRHTACSAATLLFPETRFNLIRLGVSMYGLWSSEETRSAAAERQLPVELQPALAWKTIVAQVKNVAKGTPVSYGLTECVARDSKLAVLPVGYYDGYDRVGMSSKGVVLIRGVRCKIVGRVCMNMCVADVTDVPGVRVEDEVVLLGRQKGECVSAEELAKKAETINYEIVARINPLIPRIVVA